MKDCCKFTVTILGAGCAQIVATNEMLMWLAE